MYKGVIHLNCKKESAELMHKYLDGDLTKEEETRLRTHLEDCSLCQKHFHELKRTISLIKSVEQPELPADFTNNIMKKLPQERKRMKYIRWFKMHPVLTAAAIFLIFMVSGVFSAWQQDNKLTVSKQEDLIIKGDMVIVPSGVTVDGDLVVKNGNLKIEGTVDGNVTLINGKLIEDTIDGEGLMASVGEVNGEFKNVDQIFEWILFHLQNLFKSVFSFG